MKHKIFYLFLFTLFLFSFQKEVLAYGVDCKYEIPSATGGGPIGTINITYNGEGDPTVKVKNYHENLGIYLTSFQTIPYQALYKRTDENNLVLVCPKLYWKYQSSSIIYYNVCYDQSECAGSSDASGEISATNDSIVDNDDKTEQPDNLESLSCAYQSTKNSAKSLSFVINKNKNTGELTFTNATQRYVSEYDKFNFEFKDFSFQCPDYLNVKSKTWGNKRDFILSPSEKETEYKYTGTPGYADENEAFLTYMEYNSSKAKKFVIQKSGNGYKATLEGAEKTIKNMSPSLFSSGNIDDYPSYIVETDSGFEFVKTKPSNYKSLYMLKEHLLSVVGSGEATIEATCKNIIGDTFLEFLNNNVFKIIYIGIPVLLILLTTFDFAKVVFIDDKEGIQGAWKKFGKRVVVSVLIYLVPTILITLTNIIGANKVQECASALKELSEKSK